jgi:hypothetical protein
MSLAAGVARALARRRGAVRLLPDRIRGAVLRRAVERLLRDRPLDLALDALAGTNVSRPTPTPTASPALRAARR